MSMPVINLSCEKCGFWIDVTTCEKVYMYVLTNGQKVCAPYLPGYCFDCKKINHIALGMSKPIIEEKLKNLQLVLGHLKMSGSDSRELGSLIYDIGYDIEKYEYYLLLLDNRTSRNYCLSCGGFRVSPYFEIRGKYWPNEKTETIYTHPNCGGRLYIEEIPLRFSYEHKEIMIEPEF